MIGVRSQESGVRSQESGVRSQESGVGSQGSKIRSQESGVRSQESEVRSQGPEVRSQGSGTGSRGSEVRSQEKEKIGAQKSLGVLCGEKGMEYLRAEVVIHGLVQGVYFRAGTREEAERLGVGGWVRNLPDGNVQALIEGEKKKVEQLLAWCHKGPPGARVTKVDISWEPYVGEYKRFDIRYGW